MATKQALFEGIDNLVDLLNARTKQASTPSDPGGYQGGSSHPTAKDVDNHGQSPSEGSRSSENASDVKKEVGGQSVDSTGELGADVQDKQQPNIGTQQAATGEDPSVEDDYKAGKEDPGSSHPARTDNNSLDGCKYASASFGQLHTLHDSLANSILADIANFGEQLIPEKTAGAKVKPAATKTAAAKPADTSADLLAGYELAAMLGAEKTAAQQQVTATLEACLNDALLDADLLGSAIQTFRQKRAAAADGGESEDHDQPGDTSTGAGDADAGAEAESAGGPPGAGAAPGGDAPLGGGGLGDALGGGADPGGMAGGMGGGVGKEEALMQLVAALDELGIPIEELAALGGGGAGGGMPPGADAGMGGMGGGMGGGMPPGGDPAMGGMPPDPAMGGMPPGGGAPPMPEGMKLASAAKSFRRSGKYQFKTAENGTRERAIRDYMKNYVRELAGA